MGIEDWFAAKEEITKDWDESTRETEVVLEFTEEDVADIVAGTAFEDWIPDDPYEEEDPESVVIEVPSAPPLAVPTAAQTVKTVAVNIADTIDSVQSVAETKVELYGETQTLQVEDLIENESIPVQSSLKDTLSTTAKDILEAAGINIYEGEAEVLVEEVANKTAYQLQTQAVATVRKAAESVKTVTTSDSGIVIQAVKANNEPTTQINLRSLLADYTAGTVPNKAVASSEDIQTVMRNALEAKNIEQQEIRKVVTSFEGTEKQKVVLADQLAEVNIGYVKTLLATLKDDTASDREKRIAEQELGNYVTDVDALEGLSGDILTGEIYQQMANIMLEESGISKQYLAYGAPNAIYSTAGLEWALFGKNAIETNYSNYYQLTLGINWQTAMYKDISDKWGSDLSSSEINRIVTEFPFLGLSIMTGDVDQDRIRIGLQYSGMIGMVYNDFNAQTVKEFIAAYDAYVVQPISTTIKGTTITTTVQSEEGYGARSTGIISKDDKIGWARFILTAQSLGASADDIEVLLYNIREAYDEEGQATFDEWLASGECETDQKVAAATLDTFSYAMSTLKSEDYQPVILAGTALTGGAAGFALKGIAGAAGAALMAPFVTTELPNLDEMKVFAESTVQEMADYGVPNAAESWDAYVSRISSLTKSYDEYVESGDFANADKAAFKMLEATDNISEWILNNKYALEKAGVLDDVVSAVQETGTVAEALILGTETSEDFYARKLELPSEFNPKTDVLVVNGTEVEGLDSTILELPPGDYTIGVSLGSSDVKYYDVSTSDFGIAMVAAGIADEGEAVPLWAFTGSASEQAMVAEVKSKTEARATAVVESGSYQVPVSVPDGWQYKDPITGEWKDSGIITFDAYTGVYLELIDENGYARYTKFEPQTTVVPENIRVSTSSPFAEDENGQSYIVTSAFTERYGDNKGALVVNEDVGLGTTILIDGKEYAEGEKAILDVGTYTITVQREGYQDEYKQVTVTNGIIEEVLLVPRYTDDTVEVSTSRFSEGNGGIYRDPALGDEYTVYVDGVELYAGIGQCVEAGYHNVTVTREGYETESRQVYVSEGKVSYVSDYPSEETAEGKAAYDQALAEAKKGTSLIKIDPSLPEEYTYTVDGFELEPGDSLIVDPGSHTLVVYREGYDPEVKTVNVDAYETAVTGEIPTYEDTSTTKSSSSSGGGGGGGGGSSSSTKTTTTTTTTTATTISFGPNLIDIELYLDSVQIVPEQDVKYSVEAGYHTILAYADDGYGIEKQVYCSSKQNTYVNPVLEEDFWTTEEEEEETETVEEEEEEEEEVSITTEEETEGTGVYYVSFVTDPEGAKVIINGTYTGEYTPCRIPLNYGIYYLELYKSGYNLVETYIFVMEDLEYGQEALNRAYRLGLTIPEV